MTPNPGFKVTVLFKGKYLNNGTFYRQGYHITLMGSYGLQAIEWYQFR